MPQVIQNEVTENHVETAEVIIRTRLAGGGFREEKAEGVSAVCFIMRRDKNTQIIAGGQLGGCYHLASTDITEQLPHVQTAIAQTIKQEKDAGRL